MEAFAAVEVARVANLRKRRDAGRLPIRPTTSFSISLDPLRALREPDANIREGKGKHGACPLIETSLRRYYN
jgi:hypothetical protein